MKCFLKDCLREKSVLKADLEFAEELGKSFADKYKEKVLELQKLTGKETADVFDISAHHFEPSKDNKDKMENKKPYSVARIIFNNSCEEREIRFENPSSHSLFMTQIYSETSYIKWHFEVNSALIIYKSAIKEIRISWED